MNILIIGVSGFIGSHIYRALLHDVRYQHHITGCSRQRMPNINWQVLDFNQSTQDWIKQLQNIELVINAVGIYQQSRTQSFLQCHDVAPKRVFSACQELKIKVIQISAIGAEQEYPVTEFLSSKRAADMYVLESDLPNVVLYPGIVLGEQGRTTQQLSLLARLYCIPLLVSTQTQLPLISIEQLTKHILDIINFWPDKKQAQIVIAKPETLQHTMNNIRLWMGLTTGRFIVIPRKLIDLLFYCFPVLSVGIFNKQSMNMSYAVSSQQYLSVTKQSATELLMNNSASMNFTKKLNRKILFYINITCLVIIWIMSGLSSIINIEQSRQLLSLMAINTAAGDIVIYTAAITDILLGLFLCYPPFRRKVIFFQIGIIVIYSLIISIFIPIFWLHPFAPIIKNLAIIVLSLYLLIEKKE